MLIPRVFLEMQFLGEGCFCGERKCEKRPKNERNLLLFGGLRGDKGPEKNTAYTNCFVLGRHNKSSHSSWGIVVPFVFVQRNNLSKRVYADHFADNALSEQLMSIFTNSVRQACRLLHTTANLQNLIIQQAY